MSQKETACTLVCLFTFTGAFPSSSLDPTNKAVINCQSSVLQTSFHAPTPPKNRGVGGTRALAHSIYLAQMNHIDRIKLVGFRLHTLFRSHQMIKISKLKDCLQHFTTKTLFLLRKPDCLQPNYCFFFTINDVLLDMLM